jgi:uncharacterized protein
MNAPQSIHTADGRFVVDLHNFPIDGRDFAGSFQADIFQLEPGGPTFVGPFEYELHIELRGPWLVVQGYVAAAFQLECVRCTETFLEILTLDDYSLEEELGENSLEADLTERIREDMLLALPGYPHCDESESHPRDCPAAQRFASEKTYSTEHPEDTDRPDRKAIWETLDQLKLSAR